MRFYDVFGWLGMASVISACAENPSHLNTNYLDRYADPNPTLASVLECHGFNCSETSRAALKRDAWRHVEALFVPRAKDAQTERRQIAHASSGNRRVQPPTSGHIMMAKLSYAGSPIDPRNTAVLQEIDGPYFAIDASLVDVGVPPPIIPLESWLAHWPPDLPASEAPVRLTGMPKSTTPTNNRL